MPVVDNGLHMKPTNSVGSQKTTPRLDVTRALYVTSTTHFHRLTHFKQYSINHLKSFLALFLPPSPATAASFCPSCGDWPPQVARRAPGYRPMAGRHRKETAHVGWLWAGADGIRMAFQRGTGLEWGQELALCSDSQST